MSDPLAAPPSAGRAGAGRRGRRPRGAAARHARRPRRCRWPGTSEGRQLRRWLTQLLVTERVIAAEAARARRDRRRGARRTTRCCPTVGRAAGDRQRGRGGAGRPVGPGAVRLRHGRRRRQRRRRRRLPRPQPDALRRRSADAGTAGARDTGPPRRCSRCARRSPSTCWRRPPPRVPACGSTPGGPSWSARSRLRTSRRSPPARQHRTDTDGRTRRWRSTSAAPRSPPGSSTPTARWSHHDQLPTPRRRRRGVWAVVDTLITEATRRSTRSRPRRRHRVGRARSHLPTGHRQPDQHHRVATTSRSSTGWPQRCRRCRSGSAATACAWRSASSGAAPGRGAPFMLGMVVSTGVGGGLVLDGAPYDGRTGNAGHVGHVVVDPDGAPCTCGGRGCVETIAGGPAHGAVGARQRLGRAAGGRRQGAGRRRRRRGPGGAAGVPARRDRGRGDDRVGRARCATWTWWSSAAGWRSRARCCSTRCARRWPGTPAWTSSGTEGGAARTGRRRRPGRRRGLLRQTSDRTEFTLSLGFRWLRGPVFVSVRRRYHSNMLANVVDTLNAGIDALGESTGRACRCASGSKTWRRWRPAARRARAASGTALAALACETTETLGDRPHKVIADRLRISPAQARRRLREAGLVAERATLTGQPRAADPGRHRHSTGMPDVWIPNT